jgi:glutathione peroxidase-family protein
MVHIQSKLVMLKSYEPTILLLINQAFKISVQFTITMNRLYSYNLTEFKIIRFDCNCAKPFTEANAVRSKKKEAKTNYK